MAKSKAKPVAKKSCFVISPIGNAGSDTRRRSDCAFEYIIKPSLNGLGYDEPERVDKSDKPTHITTEIILQLVNADLVIADLSELNANVFYELGIRHAFKKPCILMSNWEKKPPFDVSGINVIDYIHDDPQSHKKAIGRIKSQIEVFGIEGNVSNPVTVAFGFEKLEESGDEKDKMISELVRRVDGMSNEISSLQTATETNLSFHTSPLAAGGLADSMRNYDSTFIHPRNTGLHGGILSLDSSSFRIDENGSIVISTTDEDV